MKTHLPESVMEALRLVKNTCDTNADDCSGCPYCVGSRHTWCPFEGEPLAWALDMAGVKDE